MKFAWRNNISDLAAWNSKQVEEAYDEMGGYQDILSRSDHRVSVELGISGFGDLGQDYKDGFQEGVTPNREIGHVRRHVTREVVSEDYTSQHDLESSKTLARDLETYRVKGN